MRFGQRTHLGETARIGNRFYLLTAAGKGVQPSGGDAFRFLDSFVVTAGPEGELAALRAQVPATSAVAFSPDGRTLASMGQMELQFWDATNGREVGWLPVQGPFAFSPDGKTLATWGDGFINLRDAATRRLMPTRIRVEGPGLGPIAFSPDSKTLAFPAGLTVHR
jgi:WD40 repeat protein